MPGRVLRGVFSAVLLSALLAAVPASAAARVYVRVAPPARVVEVRPAAPGPRYIWVEGFHRWDGHAYAWVPGRWALPPKGRAAWVPGHWAHGSRGWFFVEGHWRR
jgi:YXWGXW repeat-containing protein